MVTFICNFRPYLLGHTFKLRTDHSSLQWLQNFHEPESQLAKWFEQLQEYNFKTVHRAVNRHSNTDVLSRRPINLIVNEEEHSLPPMSVITALAINGTSREDPVVEVCAS